MDEPRRAAEEADTWGIRIEISLSTCDIQGRGQNPPMQLVARLYLKLVTTLSEN